MDVGTGGERAPLKVTLVPGTLIWGFKVLTISGVFRVWYCEVCFVPCCLADFVVEAKAANRAALYKKSETRRFISNVRIGERSRER